MHDNMQACAAAHGFELVHSTDVSEIDGRAYVMRHVASGARLLFLENEDPNKAFSITFKTPAADNTGVFHILEHSVLCGSEKYPVKEPFVNLLKSSMQTFLNAMTFPDKTMYPVASTNDQDLLNLADVYMDAVFHPLIYKKPTTFEQEGWHYEFADSNIESPLVYNGVVYNEMKGALSEPDSVLYDALSAALFPDTTYKYEAGGTPESIPTLTYECFLDTHSRHYVPENSYFVLYGNLDIDRFLQFIDEQYLTPIVNAGKNNAHPNPLKLQKPVRTTGVVKNMSTAPENSCAAMGMVVGDASQRERLIATDILLDAIMGSNEAPMKRAILDANLADDAFATLADSIAQPFAMVELKGLREGAAQKFPQLVREEAERLANGGLDRELVRAALSHAEFIMREHNLGYADGVIYAMSAMSSWLYDDERPLDFIRYEDVFESLRAKIDSGYFEQLIRELFLDCDHYAEVEVRPVETDDNERTAEMLASIKAEMTGEELDAIVEDVKLLRQAQETPDSPEAIDKLPYLSIEDIQSAPEEPEYHMEEGVLPCLMHSVPTHGIAYAYRYFDLSVLNFDELPYASVLASVLSKLDTENSTAAELDLAIQAKLGNLAFLCEVHESEDPNKVSPKFVVSSSALQESVPYAASIANEIIQTTNFCNYDKMLDVLQQRRIAMEQSFAAAGHSVASARSSSYYMPAAVAREAMNGISFYMFLKQLIDEYDVRKESLADKLQEISERIFTDDNCVLSFAGPRESFDSYMNAGIRLGIKAESPKHVLEIPAPENKNEAFIVPTDVTYTALGADRRSLANAPYSGQWLVASRVLSFDYLWQQIRVIGGAYGAGYQMTKTGSSRYYSYRDPHVDETVQRMKGAGEWLSEDFRPDEKEFTGYIVSTAATFDAPQKPRDLMRKQDGMFFAGYTPEQRLMYREQVVNSKLEDIQALGNILTQLADNSYKCVIGNRDIINSSELQWNIVQLV